MESLNAANQRAVSDGYPGTAGLASLVGAAESAP
jgi:hypothetical protein